MAFSLSYFLLSFVPELAHTSYLVQLPMDQKERASGTKRDSSNCCIESCIIYWTNFLLLRVISDNCGIWVSWFIACCWDYYQSNAGMWFCWLMLPTFLLLCSQALYIDCWLRFHTACRINNSIYIPGLWNVECMYEMLCVLSRWWYASLILNFVHRLYMWIGSHLHQGRMLLMR